VELESWDVLEERGKRIKREQDDEWRRRDSVTHLIASIYADIETAVELQRRLAGTGDALTQEERDNFESSEDDRLDYLREIRLAARFSSANETNKLKAAPVSRGKRFEAVRAGRDVVCRTAKVKRKLLSSMVDTLGWPVVVICLHSINFRTRFLEAIDAEDYAKRLEQLRQNKESIEFFAKSRKFHWLEKTPEQEGQDVLFRDLNCVLTGTPLPQERDITEDEADHARIDAGTRIAGFPTGDAGIDHPHEWELSADGLTAKRLEFLPGGHGASPQLQRNVAESIVLLNGQKWKNRANWMLKDDPRYRSNFDNACEACDQLGEGEGKNWKAACECSLENLKIRHAAEGGYVGDRVELRNIHPIMGTGVRALQRLPANSLLAEYVGEIYPINEKNNLGVYNNATYLFHQMRALAQGRESAMYIDPAIYGNWTRYMNHSCNPKANFMMYSCGEKILTIVTVRNRPIEFGEEITVNYGSDYFVGMKLGCRCGEDVCKLWNADKVEKNTITLRRAKQQGIAPGWAA
jgi:SET domain